MGVLVALHRWPLWLGVCSGRGAKRRKGLALTTIFPQSSLGIENVHQVWKSQECSHFHQDIKVSVAQGHLCMW